MAKNTKRPVVGDALRLAKVWQDDLDAILQDRKPMQRAQSMAQAVASYLYDLYMDDAGDERRGYVKELQRALKRAEKVVNSIGRLEDLSR